MTYLVRKVVTGCLTERTMIISRTDHKSQKCVFTSTNIMRPTLVMRMRMAYSKRKVMRGFRGGRKTMAEPASENPLLMHFNVASHI